jgi:TRAP-type C4-dicarboxylate transport system permease small subunit
MENHTRRDGPRVLKGLVEKIGNVLAVIAGVALTVTMLAMTVDAVGRKTVGPLPGAYEASMALLVLVMFLPQAFTERKGAHISVDLLTRHLPFKLSSYLRGMGAVLGMAVFILVTWLGVGKAYHATLSGETWPGIVNFPVWPFRWVVPLGSGALVLQYLLTAIEMFSADRENR